MIVSKHSLCLIEWYRHSAISTTAQIILFSLAVMFSPRYLLAQGIYNCAGTWTNHPCPGTEPLFVESVRTASPGDVARETKERYVHRLIKARYEVKDKIGMSFDTREVERFCNDSNTIPAECEKKVDIELQRLENRAIEVKKIQLQQRDLELRAQELEKEGDRNQTVIIQNVVPLTPSWVTPAPVYTIPLAPSRIDPLNRPGSPGIRSGTVGILNHR
jgi:hypothetical protein